MTGSNQEMVLASKIIVTGIIKLEHDYIDVYLLSTVICSDEHRMGIVGTMQEAPR